MKQQMTVNMNGLRNNLIRSYNNVVRHLREHIEDNLTDYECDELHDALFEDFEELRQNIGFLLCVYDSDDNSFSDMSEEIENLEDFEDDELEDLSAELNSLSADIAQRDWHTGTPTENGYYLCKVFYDKETENDMRILEWVKELDCFCIPYSCSKIRAYHYYVGENDGEHVEVVYEWQKLDMRFRMETKWIEPYKEER